MLIVDLTGIFIKQFRPEPLPDASPPSGEPVRLILSEVRHIGLRDDMVTISTDDAEARWKLTGPCYVMNADGKTIQRLGPIPDCAAP